MATEAQQPLKISLEAAGDLSASQYMFVKRDANGRAVAITSALDIPFGVLQNKPKALGQMAEIVIVGITKIVTTTAGTAFTGFDDFVASYLDGTAQKGIPLGFSAVSATGLATAAAPGTPVKVIVGKLAPIGGTGVGLPVAADVTRIIVNCTAPAAAQA